MARLPRPRTRRGTVLTFGAGVVVLGAVGLALVYFVVFPTSAPAPFALTTYDDAAAWSETS